MIGAYVLSVLVVTPCASDDAAELTPSAQGAAFVVRTQWCMGTVLRVHLPREAEDLDALFRACFDEVRRWERRLSPWIEEAPLTRLSRAPGRWVELEPALLDYLERAQADARRTEGIFDITLSAGGAARIEIDRERSRARLAEGTPPLDPGGDGKGVALDAVARLLATAGVREAFLDFGGSSFLALGSGPAGDGWRVGLRSFDGSLLGELRLIDTGLSVSDTVQREEQEDGAHRERFHLLDLRRGQPVNVRRSVAVLSTSATEAEVLSTTLAIGGHSALETGLLERFAPCRVGLFAQHAPPRFLGGFDTIFVPAASGD